MELEKKFDMKNLSYFELNLETWRQLWRVLEISDIILVIVDIRYAVSIINSSFQQLYSLSFTYEPARFFAR